MSNNIWAAFGILPGEDNENSVQRTIPRALSYLSERDQSTFRKKFREQSGDEHQAMHTFRELLVGVFMVQQGYMARYSLIIDGLTPDWHFQRNGKAELIADVVNFHVERKIEAQIDRALDEGQTWSGELPDQSQRLHSSLWDKAGKYKNLAAQKSVPYVVFIFGWMNVVVQAHQVEQCLLHAEGLFHDYLTLSGVYHMYERGICFLDSTAGYRFRLLWKPQGQLFRGLAHERRAAPPFSRLFGPTQAAGVVRTGRTPNAGNTANASHGGLMLPA